MSGMISILRGRVDRYDLVEAGSLNVALVVPRKQNSVVATTSHEHTTAR